MTDKQINRFPNSNRGFTLIEVLVTVVILSIGLLGLAGLQLHGLQGNRDGYLRTQATELATDIIDRMRANTAQMRLVAATATAYSDQSIAEGATLTPPANCIDAACNPAAIAARDLYEWGTKVQSLLPNGSALITQDTTKVSASTPATTYRLFTVTVNWQPLNGGQQCNQGSAVGCPCGIDASTGTDRKCVTLKAWL